MFSEHQDCFFFFDDSKQKDDSELCYERYYIIILYLNNPNKHAVCPGVIIRNRKSYSDLNPHSVFLTHLFTMNNLRISHIEMKITKYYHIFIYDNSIEEL